jgi:hypothetical protein
VTQRVLEGVLVIAWAALLVAPIVARRADPDGFAAARRYRRARRALARRFDGQAPVSPPHTSVAKRSAPASCLVRRRRVVALLVLALLAGLVATPVNPLGGGVTVLLTLGALATYVAVLRQVGTPPPAERTMAIRTQPTR